MGNDADQNDLRNWAKGSNGGADDGGDAGGGTGGKEVDPDDDEGTSGDEAPSNLWGRIREAATTVQDAFKDLRGEEMGDEDKATKKAFKNVLSMADDLVSEVNDLADEIEEAHEDDEPDEKPGDDEDEEDDEDGGGDEKKDD